MAEIKSALEIALERAAALGAGEDDSRREAQEKGRALARRVLEGEEGPEALGELDSGPARQAAGEALLEALSSERPGALEGLKSLAGDGEAARAWDQVAAALEERTVAREALHQQLASEMAGDLAALGIGGAAVRPNPVAHPDYAARSQEALAGPEAGLKEAGEGYLAALEDA